MKKSRNYLFTSFIFLFLICITAIPTLQANENTSILIQDGIQAVTTEEALAMLSDMTRKQRQSILSNEDKLQNLLLDFLTLKKQEQAAKTINLDKKPSTLWKLKLTKAQILSEKLKQNFLENLIIPDSLELIAKDKYDSNPEKYQIDEKVSVAHILLNINKDDTPEKIDSTYRKALNIINEISNGLDFKEAAKKYSDDKGSANSGGIINYFKRGQMVPSFEKAAFSMIHEGDIYVSPVRSKFGFHIIKLIGRIKESTIPFNIAKAELINKEISTYKNQKISEFIKQFRTNTKTTVYVNSLNTLIEKEKSKLNNSLK